MNFRLWISLAVAFLLGSGLVALLIWESWSDTTKMPASISLLIFGAVAGWLFGVLVSPYTSREEKEFSEYAKLVGTGVGGYILGKADAIFSNIGDLGSLAVVRTTSALSAFVLSAIIVFYFRRYAAI
jgi:hypothetical protein